MHTQFLNFLFVLLISSSIFNPLNASFVKQTEVLSGNEKQRIDHLVDSTEKTLQVLKKLQDKINEYRQLQQLHLKNPEDNDVLYRLIVSAHRTLEIIKAHDFVNVFDPEFIDELNILSGAVTKRGIPKP